MLTIHQSNGDVRFETPINVGSKRVFTLMGDDYVTLKFSVKSPIQFDLGDYCDVPGFGRFELCSPYKPAYNKATSGYDYELKLNAQHLKWANKIMRYLPLVGGNETSWVLTATADVHLNLVAQNIEAHGYYYNGNTSKPYRPNVQGTVEASAKTITYDSTNIVDALTAIAEACLSPEKVDS